MKDKLLYTTSIASVAFPQPQEEALSKPKREMATTRIDSVAARWKLSVKKKKKRK